MKQAFDHRLGLALNLALSGASAGLIVAPVLVTLSARDGLHVAIPEAVLTMLAALVPIIWLGMRGREMRDGLMLMTAATPSAFTTRSAIIRDARFWSVTGPFALAIFTQVGMLVFQVSYLLPLLGSAGTSLALCTSVSALIGRLALGAVVDRLNQRAVSAMAFTSQAAALGLMIALPEIPAALYAGSVLFGLFVGNVVSLPSVIIGQEFAAGSFALVIGLSTAIGQVAWSFAPALVGAVRDITGNYGAALAVCMVLQLTAALFVLRHPRGAQPACR